MAITISDLHIFSYYVITFALRLSTRFPRFINGCDATNIRHFSRASGAPLDQKMHREWIRINGQHDEIAKAR